MQKIDELQLESVIGGLISSEAAFQKALTHAGLNRYQATAEKSVLDTDGRTPKYNIVFVTGGVSYEYFINAETGQVMGFSSKRLK